MSKGKVKWFDRKKGYGFVITDTGDEAFVHFSDIMGEGFKFLDDGQSVEFKLEQDSKGYKARNVEKQMI